MTSHANVLLRGPRGRRLCLEWVMDVDQELRVALARLGYEMDGGRGTSRALLTAAPGGGSGIQPPAPSLEWIVARFASTDLPDPDDEALQAALEESVNNARYWQPPDGEDAVAALPELAGAMSRVAEQLVAAPSAQWWREPCGVEQWAIDWRVAEDTAPLPGNPAQALADWTRKERAEEVQAERERPTDPNAPWGGTWWSGPSGVLKTVGRMPAGLSLVEDTLGWDYATAIPVRGAGRTLEIRTANDWITLCRRFPLDCTASRRHDWFRTTGRHGRWVIPDWAKVATEWDAVHLTVLAYLNAAGRALTVDPETATVIAGWDPDSTMWLTDVAREWEGPRQVWQRGLHCNRWLYLKDT